MVEYGAPMQYRIKLDGGDTLIVTLEIETAEEVLSQVEPENIGIALLSALGISRPTTITTRAGKPIKKGIKNNMRSQADPAEDNADTWLRQTSEKSLGTKFKRQTRADGDTAE